jgi:hypothetical protein
MINGCLKNPGDWRFMRDIIETMQEKSFTSHLLGDKILKHNLG